MFDIFASLLIDRFISCNFRDEFLRSCDVPGWWAWALGRLLQGNLNERRDEEAIKFFIRLINKVVSICGVHQSENIFFPRLVRNKEEE